MTDACLCYSEREVNPWLTLQKNATNAVPDYFKAEYLKVEGFFHYTHFKLVATKENFEYFSGKTYNKSAIL